jgi:hypothetical protein
MPMSGFLLDFLSREDDKGFMTTTIQTTESAGIYRANVTHPCGHVYKSESGWNTEASARRHGQNLAKCACSTCRSR